ncbi:hypothetical protein MXL46_08060 [Heyndrickxia sporothermodurans]|uniref:hypothetical protein n=1 Tax=Heyndrickxia sporothermodurans TaxID=46224 RepID=UPI002DB5C0BB|nr:hypothetical protein [Heyndrickxia sporothermodurans]MEB6549048.1 hypothetical protein [Heyndrickxia sporothermodurans]
MDIMKNIVNMDEDFFEDAEVVNFAYSPDQPIGILIILEQETILRFYLLERTSPDQYKMTRELQAFQFFTKEEAVNLGENIEHMSALDLMLVMSTHKNVYSDMNNFR